MTPDQESELLRIQALAFSDTIKLVDQAQLCNIDNKVDRGDMVWLYRGANQSIAIAARIEQLLSTKQTSSHEEDNKQAEAIAAKLITSVKKEYSKRKTRIKTNDEKQGS